MDVSFREIVEPDSKDCWTRYHGAKVRVAVFFLGPHRVALGLSDTHRCAKDQDACRRLLANLGDVFGLPIDAVSVNALALNVLCRKITQWKDKPKRDPVRQPVQRRRMYL